jgi:hypothetical protein
MMVRLITLEGSKVWGMFSCKGRHPTDAHSACQGAIASAPNAKLPSRDSCPMKI